MDTGTKISAIAHVGLIGWVMLEGVFSGSAPPPESVQKVSVISAEDFAALTAPDLTVPQIPVPPQPSVAPVPDRPEATAIPATPDPIAPLPDPVAPTPPAPLPTPAPEAPPEAAVLAPVLPDLPDLPEPPQPVEEPPGQQQSDRVAPEPVAPPEEDVAIDIERQEAITPDTTGEVEAESRPETAEEAASDRIVTEAEADETAGTVPFQPPRLRPAGLTVPEPKPDPTPQPEPQPEPQPTPSSPADTATEAAVNDALDQLLGQPAAPAPSSAPSGPPLTAGEKDGLRVAVSKCWNVGSLSTDALAVTVIVGVSMAQDGKPDIGSIRMLSYSGGSSRAAETAFQAARRAIIRCGARGFDLPVEKYDQWREIEITFNPERMRIK